MHDAFEMHVVQRVQQLERQLGYLSLRDGAADPRICLGDDVVVQLSIANVLRDDVVERVVL